MPIFSWESKKEIENWIWNFRKKALLVKKGENQMVALFAHWEFTCYWTSWTPRPFLVFDIHQLQAVFFCVDVRLRWQLTTSELDLGEHNRKTDWLSSSSYITGGEGTNSNKDNELRYRPMFGLALLFLFLSICFPFWQLSLLWSNACYWFLKLTSFLQMFFIQSVQTLLLYMLSPKPISEKNPVNIVRQRSLFSEWNELSEDAVGLI